MVKMTIDFGPKQGPITEQAIADMLKLTPRRMKLSEGWPEPLHKPRSEGEDWSLVLPFCETFKNAFTACHVEHIGLRVGKGRCFTFLTGTAEDDGPVKTVQAWVDVVGQFVAIRDCLALSFALDFDRANGNPDNDQTEIGALRSRAKPYDAAPTKDTYAASGNLVASCLTFLAAVKSYKTAELVVAMPPSRPDKAFDLPTHLAAGIAKSWKKVDASKAVKTVKARPPLKNTAVAAKLAALKGSIEVDSATVKGRIILLVDDLYQSGISMNYVAMLLLEAGAKKVFGLACEKTCRNDDNVSGSP